MSERDITEIFQENFLVNVGCELRFLPLLEIHSDIPTFQKKIREEFPRFNVLFGVSVGGLDPFGVSSQINPPSELREWVFTSQDQIRTVKVGINRIVIVVKKYSEFKEFYDLISQLFEKFKNTFDVKNYVRAGIRFTNNIVFDEEEAKNPAKAVQKLFNPLITNERIANYDFFRINTAFRWKKEENKVTVKNNLNIDAAGNYHYIIDIDSYTEKTLTFEEIKTVFEKLNNIAVREFHDNITDELIQDLRSFNNGKSK
ncbi:MAG: TIGR04255 family protein [Candidatus Hodarchaeales archaeon]